MVVVAALAATAAGVVVAAISPVVALDQLPVLEAGHTDFPPTDIRLRCSDARCNPSRSGLAEMKRPSERRRRGNHHLENLLPVSQAAVRVLQPAMLPPRRQEE